MSLSARLLRLLLCLVLAFGGPGTLGARVMHAGHAGVAEAADAVGAAADAPCHGEGGAAPAEPLSVDPSEADCCDGAACACPCAAAASALPVSVLAPVAATSAVAPQARPRRQRGPPPPLSMLRPPIA